MTKEIRIAKGRFEAFSDGVFAIAITLLVLSFQPPKLAVADETSITSALFGLWPQYLVYVASFASIGIMWFNHYALFHYARHISYIAVIANLALLLFVSFLPFPTLLLGQYVLLPAAVFFYGLNLFLISVCFGILWYVATRKEDEAGGFADFVRTRNFWNTAGLVVYALGMALAFVSPIASIVLFALIAFYYLLPASARSTLDATAAAHDDREYRT